MKHIVLVIKQFFSIDDLPLLRTSCSRRWTVWIVGTFVLFGVVLEDEILSLGTTTVLYIGVGIIFSARLFHDKNYVESKLKKRHKNLLAYLYINNLVLMAIGEVLKTICQWGEIDLSFLAKESVFLVFWLLSIPLVLFYNIWRWSIWTAILLGGTIGYKWFLDYCLKHWHTMSFAFFFLTIGVVLITGIVSCIISGSIIKKLFS